MSDREILGREDIMNVEAGEPTHIITVTWVAPDVKASPRVLECYLDYEPFPSDHPHIVQYEADLARWAETSGDDSEEPGEPIREHWYLVAEQGVGLGEIINAVSKADTALDNAPQARDNLVRRYLEKKYPPKSKG